MFNRKGRKKLCNKNKMKENAKITQQKGRRIPIQMQDQVDAEFQKLL